MEIIGIIVVFGIGFVIWKVLNTAKRGAERDLNKMVYAESHKSVADMLDTTITFEAMADKEKIISNFLADFPAEAPALSLNTPWICSRATDKGTDGLYFVIGVRAFHFVENATVPVTMAKLSFEASGGTTRASFAFVERTVRNTGTAPFAKQMEELVGIIKDTFMHFDGNCKITEAKGGVGV